jgi:glyoxylase-like metal-dependent hydrolase (beta-lactamase superfamily II)
MTNCYIIGTAAGVCLIDCGNPWDRSALQDTAAKAGIDLTAIRFLILTHHHSDHCGLIKYLKSVNPELRIIMSKTCAEYLKTGSNVKQKEETYSNRGLRFFMQFFIRLSGKISENFPAYTHCQRDILIECDGGCQDSDSGPDLKFLMTPGHTPDGISVIYGSDAFVGDAARNILNFTGTPFLPILNYDLNSCYRSWDKLIESGVTTIYPAHGRAFDVKNLNPSPVIED